MEIEKKIQDDFEFYCKFTETFPTKKPFPKQEDNYLCEAWIHKLTGEQYSGIGDLNNRNIFLANLVICMQKLELDGPFTEYPPDWGLPNAQDIFGESPREIKEPLWLHSIVLEDNDFNCRSKDGRTYLATKNMPDGKGALGYLAVSLADGENQWLEKPNSASRCATENAEININSEEIESILIKRRNPEERERTLKYYDYLLYRIKRELDGVPPAEEDDAIEGLMAQLIEDLKNNHTWDEYDVMPQKAQRQELLLLLEDRIHERKLRLAQREQYLDTVEQKFMPDTLWETTCMPSDKYKQDKEAHANRMWEQAINLGPKKKLMNILTENYPTCLVVKLLTFVARDKEKVAVQLQRRHEHIVSQLKKELRKENHRGKKKCEDAQYALEEIYKILEQFRAAADYCEAMENKRQEILAGGKDTRDEIYYELRDAMVEAQQNVEAEAEHGKWLSDAINNINDQTERYQKINEENIRKIEDANIILMKNIKQLGKQICLNEKRLIHLNMMCRERDNLKNAAVYYPP